MAKRHLLLYLIIERGHSSGRDMDGGPRAHGAWSERIGQLLLAHSGWIILGVVALTVLLFIPVVAMEPDEDASVDPGGDVFDLDATVENRFSSPIEANGYIVEASAGDMLTQAALWELYGNSQRLRDQDQLGLLAPPGLPQRPYLYRYFDLDADRSVVGLTTLADELVLSHPAFGASLESASDDQVKLAVHLLFSNPQTSGLRDSLSSLARSERRVVAGVKIDYWTSPALIFGVVADNEALGGLSRSGGGLDADETELGIQEFNRNVQKVLRGGQETYGLWGFAIDQNLEAEDEGRTAGIFVMFTVVAAVAVVGLSLRSYWATALTGVGLGVLIIWLQGLSNLVGLKGGLIIEFIVPIAMISLGVDFAVHALRRYQEEKAAGFLPRRALLLGFAGVLGALALAMLSDGIAFLSNTSSGIEGVIHFGLAAGIAVASSFLVLGIVVPLAMMRIDGILLGRTGSRPGAARPVALIPVTLIRGAGGAGAAMLAGTSVILLAFVAPLAGAGVLVATLLVFLVLPLSIACWRSRGRKALDSINEPQGTQAPGPAATAGDGWLAGLVSWTGRYRIGVLVVTAALTVAAALLALRLDPQFDVKDFFDSDSDFVVGLDKLDEHVAQRGGEPGIVYIQGDLTDPSALVAVRDFLAALSDNPYVGRDSFGEPAVNQQNFLYMLEVVTGSPAVRARVEEATGVQIVDADGDGLPDAQEQVRAVYEYVMLNGVPREDGSLVFDPGQVQEVLSYDAARPREDAATLTVGIPGTRQQATIRAARESLSKDLGNLLATDQITRAGVTGNPFIREAQLDAVTSTLQTSLPIAAGAALVLLAIAMRSIRYAVVTVVPIGLVVAWLYALMYLLGFGLNLVTATIGAISIGVGIDYSIHMTERFREEMGRAAYPAQALRRAARGTGAALLTSAVSSIVGFTILGFAPMPLFASFGVLTAVMIFLALTASLVVLPPLLLVVTPSRVRDVLPEGAGQG